MEEIRSEYEQQLEELRVCNERLRLAMAHEREVNDDLEQEVLILKKQLESGNGKGLGAEKEAYYQNLIAQYSTSVSWRITKPVRFVGRILKKMLGRV